jgi:hypothetical protein
MTMHVKPATLKGLLFATLAASLVAAATITPVVEAHKAITSPFTYNDHIFPILRERCGRCHYEGGPTPMSLLTYNDAVPWAESMREQLVGERMPAWYADPLGPATKGGHTITPRELDMLVTWATGGTPQGDLAKKPAPVPPPPQWRSALGRPDVTIAMAEEHTVPPNTMEDTINVTIPTGLKEEKWVSAVDVLPGSASMVREVTVRVENGPVLAAWVPGYEAIATPNFTAFKLAPGARLALQIRYKKHYLDEQNAVKDKTTVGLYFTEPPLTGREIQSLAVDGKPIENTAEPQTFSGSLKTGARIVAFRPLLDQTYSSIDVHAVLAGGRTVPLLKLHAARPDWPRRYWLAEPIELPPGARIEAVVKPEPPNPDDIPTPRRDRLQIGVDYVAQ